MLRAGPPENLGNGSRVDGTRVCRPDADYMGQRMTTWEYTEGGGHVTTWEEVG